MLSSGPACSVFRKWYEGRNCRVFFFVSIRNSFSDSSIKFVSMPLAGDFVIYVTLSSQKLRNRVRSWETELEVEKQSQKLRNRVRNTVKWSLHFCRLHQRERESLKCLTSPDPKKAAACRKRHAWADHLASPHGRTKKIEIEKSEEEVEQKKIKLSIRRKTNSLANKQRTSEWEINAPESKHSANYPKPIGAIVWPGHWGR